MENNTIIIHDVASGTEIEREMTPEELQNFNFIREEKRKIEEEKAILEAEAQKAKEAAQAKLAALGLTTDDLQALGL
jgi:5'-3' exonuclease